MTELANLLPAIVGLILGLVALVSAHVATRRLQVHRNEAREMALAAQESIEPHLPLAGIAVIDPTRAPRWYGEGGAIAVTVHGEKRERV